MTDFDSQAAKAIPAEVHMISGSHDAQTSADVYNVDQFQVRYNLLCDIAHCDYYYN